MTFTSEIIARLSVFRLARKSGFSLSLDHDFKVLARQHQRTVARTVAALHKRQQVLGESSLLLGAKSAEGLIDRTVVGADHAEPVSRRAVTDDKLAAGPPRLPPGPRRAPPRPCPS